MFAADYCCAGGVGVAWKRAAADFGRTALIAVLALAAPEGGSENDGSPPDATGATITGVSGSTGSATGSGEEVFSTEAGGGICSSVSSVVGFSDDAKEGVG